jgi:alpha-tubulin suppressor-like RCC1 family protein
MRRVSPLGALLILIVAALSFDAGRSLAVVAAGQAYAFGTGANGQLGDGLGVQQRAPVKMLGVGTPTLSNAVAIAAGYAHTVVLRDGGDVLATGSNSNGQLGTGTLDSLLRPARVKGVGGHGFLHGVVAVAAGHTFSAALLKDGRVVTWGDNGWGQLGDGTTKQRVNAVFVKGVGGKGQLRNVKQISLGFYHALALLGDGRMVAWGLNYNGQLGIGTSDRKPHSAPVVVKTTEGDGPLRDVRQVAAGGAAIAYSPAWGFSMALLNDGRVLTWGDPYWHVLGDPARADHALPGFVRGLRNKGLLVNVKAIAAGGDFAMALRKNGSVVAWGFSSWGQQGDGTQDAWAWPHPVRGAGTHGVIEIAAGSQHALAIKAEGTLVAWGRNAEGQVGDNMPTDRELIPVAVRGAGGVGLLRGVVAIAGGGLHSAAIGRK